MHCYGHNFVIIGSILEILDVLSSPNRVASNFGTLCDNGRLLGDNSRRFRDSDQSLNRENIGDSISDLDLFKITATVYQRSVVDFAVTPTDTGYLLLMMMTSSLNLIYTITNNVSIIDHSRNIPGLGSRYM